MERSDIEIGDITGDMAPEAQDVRRFAAHAIEGAEVITHVMEEPTRRATAADRLRHVITMGYHTPNRMADGRIS